MNTKNNTKNNTKSNNDGDRKRRFSMAAALCCLVSLTACDALMGDPNGGDCYIDSEYRIDCGADDLPQFHEPNS